MPMLQLNHAQVMELAGQLSSEEQDALFQYLLCRKWSAWVELSKAAQSGARAVAARRGQDWDTMSDPQRETLVDDVLHEDK